MSEVIMNEVMKAWGDVERAQAHIQAAKAEGTSAFLEWAWFTRVAEETALLVLRHLTGGGRGGLWMGIDPEVDAEFHQFYPSTSEFGIRFKEYEGEGQYGIVHVDGDPAELRIPARWISTTSTGIAQLSTETKAELDEMLRTKEKATEAAKAAEAEAVALATENVERATFERLKAKYK